MADNVLVNMNHTLGLPKYGRFGPGKGIEVPRGFARDLGLEFQEITPKTGQKAAASGDDFDPSTAPDIWPTEEEDINRYHRDVLEEEYARRVKDGDVQELPEGSGSGAEGSFVKKDFVKALAGTFQYPEPKGTGDTGGTEGEGGGEPKTDGNEDPDEANGNGDPDEDRE